MATVAGESEKVRLDHDRVGSTDFFLAVDRYDALPLFRPTEGVERAVSSQVSSAALSVSAVLWLVFRVLTKFLFATFMAPF